MECSALGRVLFDPQVPWHWVSWASRLGLCPLRVHCAMTVTTCSGQRWERQAAKSIRVTARIRMRLSPEPVSLTLLKPGSSPTHGPVSLEPPGHPCFQSKCSPLFKQACTLSISQREKALEAVMVRSCNTAAGVPRMLCALAHRMAALDTLWPFMCLGPLHTLLPHSSPLQSLVPHNLGPGSPPTMGQHP